MEIKYNDGATYKTFLLGASLVNIKVHGNAGEVQEYKAFFATDPESQNVYISRHSYKFTIHLRLTSLLLN